MSRNVFDSLRESEECFRQLAENTREVFWMLDAASGRLLYLSPTFEQLWGIPRHTLYDHLEDFLKVVHPDDVDRVADRLARIGEVAQDGAERELEYRIVRPDGEVRWVAVRAFPIRDAAGGVYRIGGLIADVSERRASDMALRRAHAELERRVAERTAELSESNQHLRREATERARAEQALRLSQEQLREQFAELEQLYRTAPIGLALHDTSLRFVRINERLAAIDGLPIEAHIGRSIRDILPDIGKMVMPVLEMVLASGQAALDIEVQGSTPAEPGVRRHWTTNYYPLRAADGRVVGVQAIVQDISERVWAEERARRHLEDLAHVSRVSTMGEMAAGIAHELNQPLAAIANFAFVGLHTLEGDRSQRSEELRTLLTELTDQALRAGEIVERLRSFVKKTHSPRTDVSVNVLIADVLRLIDAEIRLTGTRVRVDLAPSVGWIEADAIQIQQVVLNLLRNALEAMTRTPPESRALTLTSSARAAGCVEVAVADSGPGIPRQEGEKIFDAFFTTKPGGMGLGLAISRSIVEDHGGRLWAERGDAGGAVFRFMLPVAKDSREGAH
jgi:PAS domain S-box-containing protein